MKLYWTHGYTFQCYLHQKLSGVPHLRVTQAIMAWQIQTDGNGKNKKNNATHDLSPVKKQYYGRII